MHSALRMQTSAIPWLGTDFVRNDRQIETLSYMHLCHMLHATWMRVFPRTHPSSHQYWNESIPPIPIPFMRSQVPRNEAENRKLGFFPRISWAVYIRIYIPRVVPGECGLRGEGCKGNRGWICVIRKRAAERKGNRGWKASFSHSKSCISYIAPWPAGPIVRIKALAISSLFLLDSQCSHACSSLINYFDWLSWIVASEPNFAETRFISGFGFSAETFQLFSRQSDGMQCLRSRKRE